ncbi:MAG TPA: radical SAM protein [Pseudomonadales bacterium]
MARIAFIKLFTGLNLASAQLSGELKRAGHSSCIIHFKEHELVDVREMHQGWEWTECSGYVVAAGGIRKNLNCYRPFQDSEFELLIKTLRDFKADAVAISVVSGNIREASRITRVIHEALPLPVIWGGHGPTLEPERCIKEADLLCIHEGEQVIVDFANKLDAGEGIDGIAGTWCRQSDGSIAKYPGRPLVKLDDLAMPNWTREDNIHISGNTVTHNYYPSNLGESYAIMTQRGCPFSCSFCIESKYQDEFGKKDSLRRKSASLIIDELVHAKATLPISRVLFYDDVFTVNPRWLKTFLAEYKEKVGLPFWCWTYPTTHNPEILSWLKDAGCDAITLGLQSGSARILEDHYGRPTKISRMHAAAEEIVDSGIHGEFDMIFRHPHETEEDLRMTVDFLLDFPQKMKAIWLAEMTYFPGHHFTAEAEAAARENLVTYGRQLQVSDSLYDYYYRLFRLTRMKFPKERIRSLINNPEFREHPERLDEHMKYPEDKLAAAIARKKNNPSITY